MKNNFWLFIGVLLACFLVSAVVRYQQFETWKKTPAAYFVGERPMMTTLDAPFWLRLAREYNEGTYGQNGGLRSYPEGTETFQKMSFPQKYKDLKIVVISALDEISLERALEIGADATLQKPFSNHDLTMVLEQFMSM